MARKQFYAITNAASEEATLSIFDEIGFWGTNAADFARELAAVTAPVINLEINSIGGNVFDGVAIYNLLRASGKTINAKVMGLAASIASVILMAADKITMPANTMVMVHAPSGGLFGTAEEMRAMADVLDKVQAGLVATYVKRTGMSEDDVRAMLATDTWLTAAEAKDKGFADEVTDAVELTAKFDITDECVPEVARVAFKAAADKRDSDEAARVAAEAEAQRQREADAAAAAAATFAAQVNTALTGTGFEAHAAAFAAHFTTMEAVTARIAEAREIKALFDLADKGTHAPALIAAHKSLAEARVALQVLMAAGDQHIDTHIQGDKPETNPVASALSPINVYAKRAGVTTIENSAKPTIAGPSAVNTAAIWAKRNSK